MPTKNDQSVMNWFLSIKETENDSLTITLSGNKGMIDRIKRLLSVIAWCGDIGHSTSVEIDVDGDGSDRLKIVGFNPKDYLDEEIPSGNIHVGDREFRTY